MLLLSLVMSYGCKADEAEPSGYYIAGRVVNGATHEPIDGVSLTLVAGKKKSKATTDDQGSYRIGPIPARTAYRLATSHEGLESFEFKGLALPPLEEGEDTRSLPGDVLLYEEGAKSPAFKIVVESSDAALSLSSADSEVRFTPITVGYDPSLTGTLGPDLTSAGVIGAYREPGGTTLVNHGRVATQGYRAQIVDGMAELPEAALRWGATYEVDIDGGTVFAPVRFLLTAVRGDEIRISLRKLVGAEAGTGAPGSGATQYFAGRVYDGVSLTRLTDYAIRLEYFDRIIQGTVDATGRYVVGPLLPNSDYSIVIEADGFRSFLSHNKRVTSTGTTAPTTSLYYDAFLYPTAVQAPAVSCRFRLSGKSELPTGFVRLAPRSSSSLFDEEAELPAGVDRQVWSNDDDLQQRAVVRELVDGNALFEPGELGLGVLYAVTLYGVNDYGIPATASFRAGVDKDPVWVLDPLVTTALKVVGVSSRSLPLSPDASVVIRFNQPIALSPRVAEGTMLRALNNGFTISSPDSDLDTVTNALVATGDTATYRGVTFTVSGDALRLAWNRVGALATEDGDDPINSVTYGGLDQVWVYPSTAAQPTASSLSDLVGAATGVSTGTGNIKTAEIATNQGSLVGAATGVLGSSKGAEGLSSKKAIYTAGIPSETVVLGSMDPDVIRRILLDHLPQFRYCYQKELERTGADTSGTVKLDFTIGASGHVAQAGIEGSSALPTDVKKCVVQVLKGINFPEPMGGGTVGVKQPMNFYPKKL